MAQLLHGSATTTARSRQALQQSSEPATVLARRHHVNPKTFRKWRRRSSTDGPPMGPHQPHSSVLSPVEEAAVGTFRAQSRLPLDDVLVALKPAIPRLTRSTLHRCLQRPGFLGCPSPNGSGEDATMLASSALRCLPPANREGRNRRCRARAMRPPGLSPGCRMSRIRFRILPRPVYAVPPLRRSR